MAKELTLEELAGSVNKTEQPKAEPVATLSTISPETVGSPRGMRPTSTAALGAKLKELHPEAQKKEQVAEDSPLVKNALSGMNKTLQEKKEFIENVVLPTMEENAREMAIDNEIGDDPEAALAEENTEEKSPVTVPQSELDEDFGMLDDEDDEAPVNYESVTPTQVQQPVEEAPKVEPKKEKVVPIKPKEDDDKDNADLDEMLKDLGIDTDEEDTSDLEDEETPEELRERFKNSMSNIKIAKDPIDLSKYKIRREPISSSTALNTIKANTKIKRADWALFCSGRSMSFAECDGPELDALNKTIRSSNGISGVIASLRFVYDHVIDGNKPNFETWTKLIRTEDIESLYFGLYMACYSDTNLVVRVCDKDEDKDACGRTSLIETPIMDMVKFESDEVKEKFEKIRNMDTTSDTTEFESDLLPISDDIVIAYSKPTLYSTFIQYAPLQANITEKYSDYLNTMAYINAFYMVDRNTQTLVPIKIKDYPHNLNKTVMSKLKVFIDIIKTLSNDQYNIMKGKLNQIDSMEEATKVSYILPEVTCPECGHTIKEAPVQSVLNLLFTRAQLAQVKNL